MISGTNSHTWTTLWFPEYFTSDNSQMQEAWKIKLRVMKELLERVSSCQTQSNHVTHNE